MQAQMTDVTTKRLYNFSVEDEDGFSYLIVLSSHGDLYDYETDLPKHIGDEEMKARVEKATLRAQYILHQRSDGDVLPPENNPHTYERALDVLASMSDEEIRTQFNHFKQSLVDPTPEAWNDEVTFNHSNIIAVYQPIFFSVQHGLTTLDEKPRYVYRSDDGEKYFVGDPSDSPISIQAPPLKIPEEVEDAENEDSYQANSDDISIEVFRNFLYSNIREQYRQAYADMGIYGDEE